MNKTLLVIRNEIRTTLRRRSFMLLAVGIPLLMSAIALVVMAINRDVTSDRGDRGSPGSPPGAPAETAEPEAAWPANGVEGYVDKGGLIQALPAGIPPGRLMEYATEEAAQAALEAEEISAYTIIPADYVETGEIIHVTLAYNPIADDVNTDGIEWILLVNLLGDAELAAEMRNPLEVKVTALASIEPEKDSRIVKLLPRLMVFVLYMVILMPAGVLMNAITEEKKDRVMEVLISSISPRQMIGGKVLALGLLGLLQTALWVGVMSAVVRLGGQSLAIPAGFSIPTQLLVWALIYGLLGYAMYGAQMAGLGALAPDVKDASGASFIVLMPLIIVYLLLTAILSAPDGLLALVLSLFPLTSPVGMIARMTQTTVPLWPAVLAAALQLLTATLIVRLVARLFRAQMLLSGQPISMKRLLVALWGRA
jgi:ABC-2 type transport system permease protein